MKKTASIITEVLFILSIIGYSVGYLILCKYIYIPCAIIMVVTAVIRIYKFYMELKKEGKDPIRDDY